MKQLRRYSLKRRLDEVFPPWVGSSEWTAPIAGGSETAGMTFRLPKQDQSSKDVMGRLQKAQEQLKRFGKGKEAPKEPEPKPEPEPEKPKDEKPKDEPVEIPPAFDPLTKGGLVRSAPRDFDRYLKAIQATLQYKGYTLDEANKIIDNVANELTNEGKLPKLKPDSLDDELGRWLDSAAAVGLAATIVDRA